MNLIWLNSVLPESYMVPPWMVHALLSFLSNPVMKNLKHMWDRQSTSVLDSPSPDIVGPKLGEINEIWILNLPNC